MELAKVELTLMICSVEAVTELGGKYSTVYVPLPAVPVMEPNVPHTPPLQLDEPLTVGASVSVALSIVTAISSVTEDPPAVAVGWVGEILTTGPAAGVIVKVSESETPEPFPAVTVTVTEFGFGGAGGAM